MCGNVFVRGVNLLFYDSIWSDCKICGWSYCFELILFLRCGGFYCLSDLVVWVIWRCEFVCLFGYWWYVSGVCYYDCKEGWFWYGCENVCECWGVDDCFEEDGDFGEILSCDVGSSVNGKFVVYLVICFLLWFYELCLICWLFCLVVLWCEYFESEFWCFLI